MKKVITVLLALCLCLLAACVGLESRAPSGQEPEAPSPVEGKKPDYQLGTMTAQDTFASSDGTELASYAYELPVLSVSNQGDLPPEEAEAAERNMDNFNEKMRSLLDNAVAWGKDVGRIAGSSYADGYLVESYYDESSSSANICGQMVSVRVDTAGYTGGAHPNSYASSYLFDLGTGQFINPTQLAEAPESFRTGAAQLLLEKAEASEDRESYWSDYGEIIARWNEGTVLFDGEGMLVVYSPYELGPYAIGEVDLRLRYEEIADLLGQGGLERLGVRLEPEA